MLTQKILKKLLHYDHASGIFKWLEDVARNVKAGDIAGGLNNRGYIRITINKKSYLGHRLAWLYTYGYFPKIIDHKNRMTNDNRICNLREATVSTNRMNAKKPKNNTSGFKGVTFNKTEGKYCAYAYKDKKRYHLGYFDDPEEAYKVSLVKTQELHGEFYNEGSGRRDH